MKMSSSLQTGLVVIACLTAVGCTKDSPTTTTGGASLAERPAVGEVRAGRIAFEEERMIGGAADSAVGDYKIMNHDAVFTVHDVGNSGVYVMNGGGLLDADLWREGESWDLIYNYAPVVSSVYQFEANSVAVESDGTGESREAVIRVDGYFRSADVLAGITGFNLNPHKEGLAGTTYYRLRPDTQILEIETVIQNTGEKSISMPVGDLHIPSDHFGDPYSAGAGFARAGMQGRSTMVGAVGERNEVTFALVPAGGEAYDLSFPANIVIQKDMAVFLASQKTCSLAPGESCGWRRYGVVAKSPARVREAVFAREGATAQKLKGHVVGSPSGDPVAGARVFVTPTDAPDVVLDMDITAEDGSFFVYAQGATHVTLYARAVDRGETAVHPGALPPVPQAEGFVSAAPLGMLLSAKPAEIELRMQEPAMLTLSLKDTLGVGLPGKFTFLSSVTQPGNKAFGESRAYASDATRAVEKVVWQAHGDEIVVPVAWGSYDVVGSFGIDYEIDRQNGVMLGSGQKKTLEFTLDRAVDLTGWAQCDTHIHTSYSNHGRTSHTDRIITMAAEGLNCGAITDHDRIMDFQPLVKRLELDKRIFTFPALEVSTFLRGHINVFSLIPDPSKPNNGAIQWWKDGKNVPRLFDEMRDIGGRVIQINHGTGVGGFFTMTGYDPSTGLGGPEFSPRFDVMELVNGKRLSAVPELRDIAFSLWDRGRKKTVVGVSDSHTRIPEPGYARSLIWVGALWHQNMAEEEVLRGFLNMNAVVSSGVFAELTVDGQRSGGTVTGATKRLSLMVDAPSWVTLIKADVVWNGEIIKSFDISGKEGEPVRLSEEFTLDQSTDGWVVLEVTGAGDLWPVAPGAVPYAITNPIFVDANGDGWAPPKTPPNEGQIGPAPVFPQSQHGHGYDH